MRQSKGYLSPDASYSIRHEAGVVLDRRGAETRRAPEL